MTRSTNNSMATSTQDDSDDSQRQAPYPEATVSSESTQRRPQRKLLPNLAPAPAPVPSAASPPESPTTAASRRGRKPSSASSGISRSAREAARKQNHSRIEKLRREKINDALTSLRDLVPYDDSVKQDDEMAAEPKKSSSNGGGEKEFKLEILERTVVYLQKLKKRVQELEEQGDTESEMHGGNSAKLVENAGKVTDTPSSSRPSRPIVDDSPDVKMAAHEGDADDGEDELDPEEHHVGPHQDAARSSKSPCIPAPPAPSSISSSASDSHHSSSSRSGIRLPPISSLLQRQDLLSSPQHQHHYHPYQPLSPPNSGRSQPWQPTSAPPALHLPSSAYPPKWPCTAPDGVEELSAASMLVQFSAERSSLGPLLPESASASRIRRASLVGEGAAFQTPASILGMGHLMHGEPVGVQNDTDGRKRQRLT